MRFEKNAIDQNYLKFEFYKQNAIYSEKYDMRYKINKCTNHFTAKQPKHFIKILFQLLVKIILYGNCVILLAINKLILSTDLKNMYYFFFHFLIIFFLSKYYKVFMAVFDNCMVDWDDFILHWNIMFAAKTIFPVSVKKYKKKPKTKIKWNK